MPLAKGRHAAVSVMEKCEKSTQTIAYDAGHRSEYLGAVDEGEEVQEEGHLKNVDLGWFVEHGKEVERGEEFANSKQSGFGEKMSEAIF